MENNNSFVIPNMKNHENNNGVKLSNRKTICFATLCKNEEHCIKETLESVYKYIDTWVVHDTGSTDKTCQIITDFFKEKGIQGELFVDEWKGFDYNKTQLFNKCFGRSDYILHLDADDIIHGELDIEKLKDKDAYYMDVRRIIGGIKSNDGYKCLIFWNNKLHWKFCGVRHTTIKCIDKPDYSHGYDFIDNNIYICSRDKGSRANDKKKYYNDAQELTKQFFNTLYIDPDELNSRSVFYTAQSYLDQTFTTEDNYAVEALQWYNLYLKLKNTWIEEEYEAHLRIARLLIYLNKPVEDIKQIIDKAITIFPDRAEAYFILGKHCNYIPQYEIAYNYLKKAFQKNYNDVKNKYLLFLAEDNYGKYVLDELSLACFWTKRYEEGKKYLEKIINDPIFQKHKSRLLKNMEYFNTKLIQN